MKPITDTDAILRNIEYRAGVGTIRQRLGELDSYSQAQTSDYGGIIRSAGRSPLRKLVLAAILSYQLTACGGSSPTAPSNGNGGTPQTLSLTVYNATTGESTTKTITSPGGAVTAAQLAEGLTGVVTSEFAARLPAEGQLGALVTAAGSSASLSSGTYKIFIPAIALIPDGRSVYDCMPSANLRNGKRDFIVGVLNKSGVDANGLPMYVWEDAVKELDNNLVLPNGMRVGRIVFDKDKNETNSDLTVGFANSGSEPAFWEGNHAYMLAPKNSTGWVPDYNSPHLRDMAMEEIFEIIFGVDDICGTTGSNQIIGKNAVTGNTQWGLNAVGVSLTRRNFTRAR